MSDTELLPKPNLEPIRRVEVFTGTGRRRVWTAEDKARIVAESFESGKTVSAVARRHGLTSQQLFRWRRDARHRADTGAGKSRIAFAPVVVEAIGRCPDVPIVPAQPGLPAIEILIGAATVRIPVGTDGVTLTTVLHAVMAAR